MAMARNVAFRDKKALEEKQAKKAQKDDGK